MDKLLLKAEEVADAISVSRSRAYYLISSGAIPSIRLPGSKTVRVRVDVLREWVANQPESGDKEAAISA